MPEAKPNALINEKSPYLRQHALNPVRWMPWGDESLRKAKNDGKPVFLSIGYSSCHWCHVMERESFEDEGTAEVLNRNFIPIKVDREERPDIDSYYMEAVQAMTGGGGWPLNVFLTPDLRPFYGGTYFPPEPKYSMPSFKQVLEFVARVWKERRGEALETAEQITTVLRDQKTFVKGELTAGLLEGAYSALASSYDPTHGGFGTAPKFPLPLSISFMIRYHSRTGKEIALTMAKKSLDSIAAGGIRDHLGGGFHRYSTDRLWLVPHFEKMLYDNALLAVTFTEAYQATGGGHYRQVVEETLGWMLREMEAKGGGFYSAQDADTTQGEGTFYTWTPEELQEVLGRESAEKFCKVYGVTKAANFEGGRSILHLTQPAGTDLEMSALKERAYGARLRRPRPETDTKILTSWNGLAISAFAKAGSVLGQERYTTSAVNAADFVLGACMKEGRLLRRFADGEAGIEGTLDDYAYFTQGLIDLFEATSETKWLEEALRLTDAMVSSFWDSKGGGFYMSTEQRPARMKDEYDGPTPSGNSVAAMNLLRLSELTGDLSKRSLAEETLKTFARELREQPAGHAYMISALDSLQNGMKEVVITARRREDAQPMRAVLAQEYRPALALVVATDENYDTLSGLSALLAGRKPGASAVAYVCEKFTCKVPARSPEELRAQLVASRR